MASKQPRRSDLTSNLKLMTETTHAKMVFRTLLAFSAPKWLRKEKRRRTSASTRDVGSFSSPVDTSMKKITDLGEVRTLPAAFSTNYVTPDDESACVTRD